MTWCRICLAWLAGLIAGFGGLTGCAAGEGSLGLYPVYEGPYASDHRDSRPFSARPRVDPLMPGWAVPGPRVRPPAGTAFGGGSSVPGWSNSDRFGAFSGQPRFFSPEKHVVCDQRKRFCYDNENGNYIRSYRETRQYFGKKAARRID